MTRAAASFSFGKARGKPDGVLRVRLSSLMSHEPSFGSDSRLTVFQKRRSVRSALDVWLSAGEPDVQRAESGKKREASAMVSASNSHAAASQRWEGHTRKGR
jgi:hypothetical protein